MVVGEYGELSAVSDAVAAQPESTYPLFVTPVTADSAIPVLPVVYVAAPVDVPVPPLSL